MMATEPMIEQRLEAVERAVADLQRRLAVGSPPSDWLEQISGSFKDEPAFEEVLKCGRAIRQADRPAEEDAP
jgi:hypothetical protein